MKKARIFLSVILVVAILSGFTLPAFATNESKDEIRSISIDEIKDSYFKNDAKKSAFSEQNTNDVDSIINTLCPKINEMGDNVEIFSDFSKVSENITEDIISNNLSSFARSAQTMSLRLNTTACVYNSDDMELALATSTISTIVVMNNFTLDDSLEITRDVYFVSGAEGTVTITSAESERHFYIDDQYYINIAFEDVVLSGDEETGGGINITDSYATIDGANIVNCCPDDSGGAVNAVNNKLVNNTMVVTGSLTVVNGVFENNQADSGGAISSFGQLLISDSTIEGNSVSNGGGGIFIANLTATGITSMISNVSIDGNAASSGGGGICTMGMTTLISSSSEIINNTAMYGGGIYAVASYTNMSNSTVQGNVITNEDPYPDITELGGAGIYSVGRLSLNNTIVDENEANCNDGCGGGILAISASLTSYNYYGTENLTIVGGTINGNTSYFQPAGTPSVSYDLFGGAGIATYGLDVTVTGTTISGNDATYIGGGIMTVGDTLNLTDCTVYNNSSPYFGGGIMSENFMEILIDLEYEFEGPDINISGGEISNNTTILGGGGIMIMNEDNATGYDSHLNIDDAAVIEYNSAGLGGGIHTTDTEITIDGGSQITENLALGENLNGISLTIPWSGAGGGIATGVSSLALYDCEISDNSAIADEEVEDALSAGGGIYGGAESYIYVSDADALIEENTADYGGGIYSEDEVTISAGTIKVNSANWDGGGVYTEDTITISGGIIEYNTASWHGGGVYGKYITFPVGGSGIVRENTASSIQINEDDEEETVGKGGGLYVDSGVLTMNSGEICYNEAGVTGGGVYMKNSSLSTNDPWFVILAIHDNVPNNYAQGS